MRSLQIIQNFFCNHYTRLSTDVILPLCEEYENAGIFGKRLELILFDHLPPEALVMVDKDTKTFVDEELKKLRKVKGKNIWTALLNDLCDFLK